MAVQIDKTYIVNKDTTNFSNNTIIKKGTIVQGKMIGTMPNGDIRITTNNGEIINQIDLQEQTNVGRAISIGQAPTTEDVKQQNLLLGSNTLTTEDKFYEMLGIKKTNGGWGIQSRPLGRLLVAGALVIGYFAYKKFKK